MNVYSCLQDEAGDLTTEAGIKEKKKTRGRGALNSEGQTRIVLTLCKAGTARIGNIRRSRSGVAEENSQAR
jgi:hypothetical protein